MLKNKRHFEILEILKRESFAEVRILSERLYASQPTIRRDLDFLEKQGYVKRSHGGAMLADDKINTPISFRKGTKAKEKAQICKLAATLITPGSLIFIDGSTTAAHLSECIQKKNNITVVTNGYNVCKALTDNDIRVFSTGGRLLKNSMAFVGTQAEEAVKKYNAELLFFSSSSVSENGIISDYSEEETALRVAMHHGASRSVFLFDSGKMGKTSAFRALSISDVDYVVTDKKLSEELCEACKLTLLKVNTEAFLYKK